MKQLLILSGKGVRENYHSSAFINLSKAKAYADCDVDAPTYTL